MKTKSDTQKHPDLLDYPNLKVHTRAYLGRIWGIDHLNDTYSKNEDRMLYGFRKDIQIPEIRLRFNKRKTLGKFDSSKLAYKFLAIFYIVSTRKLSFF